MNTNSLKKLKDKIILVTGSNGQLGTSLVDNLIKYCSNIIGLDFGASPQNFNIKFLKCDITNLKSIQDYKCELASVQILIHLVGIIEETFDVLNDAIKSIDLNVLGFSNLLNYLPNLEHVCFSSSYMVYGKPHYWPIDEEHPTEPIDIYGVSKLTAEKYIKYYTSNKGLTCSILRFMGIYGPGTKLVAGRAIPKFIDLAMKGIAPKVYGKGQNRRNYVYIDDAVDAIIYACINKKSGTWNIGGSNAPSVLEIAKIVTSTIANGSNYEHVASTEYEYDFICCIEKAKKELGFVPNIDFEEGLKKEIFEKIKRK